MEERIEMIKSMDYIICNVNDEGAYMKWINVVPDAPTVDDYESIAEDDELYSEVLNLFCNLIKRYGKSGIYMERINENENNID